MNAQQLRQSFDWSHTKPDMRDRVVRAIESQLHVIVACCGELKPNTVITWCDYGYEFPLHAGNFSLRNGLDDVPNGESILATPIQGSPQ
jgi:hypothetical protein